MPKVIEGEKREKLRAEMIEDLMNPEKKEERRRDKELQDIDKERLEDYGIDEET